MRAVIASATVLALLGLNSLQAQRPKKEDVPKNLELLKSAKNASARADAAEQLGLRGQIRAGDVKEALGPLRDALKDDANPAVRKQAARALGMIGSEPEKTVPALTDALKDQANDVRKAAATALAAFGPEARSALPALRELAQESDKKGGQVYKTAIKMIMGKRK